MTRLVAGLDLGSTSLKLLVVDADDAHAEVVVGQEPTPWRAIPGGRTELDADRLQAALHDLFSRMAEQLTRRCGPGGRVEAIAASGMGETGVLVDAGGAPATPGIAWFDPRGEDELQVLAARFGDEFPARTGLPLGVQVSAVKLANLRAEGLPLAGLRWLNLPDYVVFLLGGTVAADSSLTSRTGLLDQDTGLPWPALLAELGVGANFLPPILEAGTFRGRAAADWLPPAFTGARLCVAGHDHLVSAVAGGATRSDRYHASLGTAEVLLRVLDQPVDAAARVRLARYFINCVRHVVPDKWVLVAGVKTGLLQRRVLQMAGIHDRPGRDRIDQEVLSLPVDGDLPSGTITVAGARNDDGVLRFTIAGDGVSPAELFAAVLRHGNDELARLVAAIDRELPPATATTLTGGWAGMAAVARARAHVLPAVSVSDREQDTAHGAALFAGRLLDPYLPRGHASTTTSNERNHP